MWAGLKDYALGTGKPINIIAVLENFSRVLLVSAVSPRQDPTAYLIVLRAAVEAHGHVTGSPESKPFDTLRRSLARLMRQLRVQRSADRGRNGPVIPPET